MISIRKLWEQTAELPPEERGLLNASLQLRRLLYNVIASREQTGQYGGDFEPRAQGLLGHLEDATSGVELLSVANEAIELIEEHRQRSARYFREQSAQLQSMLAMMTSTLAEISGQSEASVERLQAIERRIERASRLEDMRELKGSLAQCLAAVKDAVEKQRTESSGTVERLRDGISRVPQPGVAAKEAEKPPEATEYVAVLHLQRAGYILERFGEAARNRMVEQIAAGVQAACGTEERMMAWKNSSFVWFLKSAQGLLAVRRRVAAVVARIGQHYVEIDRHSTLLAVGVDWAAYPGARYPSMDALLADVDRFLNRDTGNTAA